MTDSGAAAVQNTEQNVAKHVVVVLITKHMTVWKQLIPHVNQTWERVLYDFPWTLPGHQEFIGQ